MERTCGKCKGKGGFAKKRHVTLNDFVSGDTGWVKCNVCGGSGVNPNYREKRCEKCGRTIGYHKDANYPPKYCPSCKSVVADEKAAKQRERERQQAMWREKTCPGLKGEGYCGKTIKYRVDWDHVPDICPDCREKAKRAKAAREAKMREKPCAREGCHNVVRYSTDWDHPPNYCKSCSEQRVKVDRDENGTLQAKTKSGSVLFTFGRCTEPPAHKQGGRSDDKREWARKGYYWVAMPGNPHLTYIVRENPVVNGFIQPLGVNEHIDTVYPAAWIKRLWEQVAIAVLSYGE